MRQCADTLLLVRPAAFAANPETVASNVFQAATGRAESCAAALEEFDRAVRTLATAGVRIIVLDDEGTPAKPDAVFPNNWFSTHEDGTIVLYPMLSALRRLERRADDIRALFKVHRTVDLTAWESQGRFLEGTGSLVLDRMGRAAYASISPRTDPRVLEDFSLAMDYSAVTFRASFRGAAVYHTNVMMSLGESFAVAALDCIEDDRERNGLRSSLERSGRELIELSPSQIAGFSANLLQISLGRGVHGIVASETGLNNLRPGQIRALEVHGKLISLNVETIEKFGGGSARCMLAEVFLEPLARSDSWEGP